MPQLQPVDHDPFAPVTVPVDHDPFADEPSAVQAAAEAAAARVRAPYARANARVSGLPELGEYFGNKLASALTAPRDAFTGKMQVTDLDTGMPSAEAMQRGQGVANLAMTGGVPFAQRGAAGMAGGKLGKFSQPEASEGITAYHGSPHDFDKFDLSKIGTGEGAQAYGHGLYFAENEGVAKGYKETLTPRLEQDPKYWKNVELPEPLKGADHKEYYALGDKMRQSGSLPLDEMARWKELHAVKDNYDRAVEAAKPTGKMYQVAIKAPPEHFLDWDKPLSEQHPKVQQAFHNPASAAAYHFGYDAADFAALPAERQKKLISETPQSAHDEILKMKGATAWEQTGRDAMLGGNVPSPTGGKYDSKVAAELAAKQLREAGIPGIKYLDQGSRGKGDGTRNFVVFDDKLIDILKKYGIAGIGALPAMNAFHFQHSDEPQKRGNYNLTPVDHDPFAQ